MAIADISKKWKVTETFVRKHLKGRENAVKTKASSKTTTKNDMGDMLTVSPHEPQNVQRITVDVNTAGRTLNLSLKVPWKVSVNVLMMIWVLWEKQALNLLLRGFTACTNSSTVGTNPNTTISSRITTT